VQEKIQIHHVSFSYQKNEQQLDKIDLTIASGDCIAVVGGSGCGKSTLTRVINGLIPSFFQGNLSGEVLINHKNIKKLSSWEIGAMVGNVFQDPRSQFFSNEVAGEIAFGCENLGLSHEEIIKRVNQTINEMGIKELLNTSIYTLSYGMRQKVAICSAKAMDPDIYVFDEPSANLDLKSTYLLADLIQKLKDAGKTIMIAEHRLFYLNGVADKYILMESGRIIGRYSAEEMQKQGSEILNKKGLRSLNFKDISVPKRTDISISPSHSIKVLNLSKSFRNKILLKNISFQYDGNEIIALVGPNGVGKSTLGKIIAGLIKETSGQVLLDNIEQRYKHRVGKVWYIPQDLDSQLFGEDLVDELTTGLKDSEKDIEKAEKILEKLGLLFLKDKHPATLSGGQKQRLVLGVAMMRDVPMIILDEPTSGLDFNSMEKVRALIKEQQKNGTKFFIISHDIEFIARTCERILKLDEGKIIEDYYLKDIQSLLKSMEYEGGKR
jgi:energy-coupling factor transporter ATP-binding protein EcfA2